jgi:hypothetical protein
MVNDVDVTLGGHPDDIIQVSDYDGLRYVRAVRLTVDGIPQRNPDARATSDMMAVRNMFDLYDDGVSPYGRAWNHVGGNLVVDEVAWLEDGLILFRAGKARADG